MIKIRPKVAEQLKVAAQGGGRQKRLRPAERGVRRLFRWWPAGVRAGKIAVFCLLVGFCFQPVVGSAQTGCEVATATIVSAEGEISVTSPEGGSLQAVAARAETRLCPGQTVLVGPRSRAAIRLEETGQVIRLDQGTALRVLPPRQRGRPLLDLSRGIINLFSPGNRPLDVQTPYVTAGVEGTEFFVLVNPSQKVAEIGVIDGRVSAENAQGRLSLGPGEAAIAQPGLPPRRIEIQPRNQVRWAIYYPPAMWELPAGAPIDPRVYAAWQAWRASDLPAAVRQVNAIRSTEGLNTVSLDYLAAILISLGRIDEASGLLDRSFRLDPSSPRVPALRAIIEVARNRPQQAVEAADAAAALAPASPAARIAQSYAFQSTLQLEQARAALLAAVPPDDPLVQARLAEVEFYLGNIRAARRAAERAIAGAPSLSRPRSILGFADLAQFFFAAAEETFRVAAELDPADPLPRLGLGLTAIRRGRLAEGTKELEIAVGLNPASSVLRSYLGKAYAADWHYDPAFRQWGLAQQLDPKDPTPWLYQALAQRSLNRPGDALADLQKSIELNDNRAVYRSRLLLDQDLATRSADLAGIYRDLGFNQAALDQGYKSVNADPASPAAHRFLSETFLALPRHETASDSELLQSLLLQPLNINPPRPRLAREGLGVIPLFEPLRIGYNEFSPLFASDGLGLLADGFAGNYGTIGGTLLANGLYRNLSMSLGQFYSRTNGIHANADLRRRITDLIFQPALSDQASLLAEFRYSDFDAGDFQNRFNLANFNPLERQTDNDRQYRLGGHFDVAPGVTFVGVWSRGNGDLLTNLGPPFAVHQHVTDDSGEVGTYLTGNWFNIVAGGSIFAGGDLLGQPLSEAPSEIATLDANDHSLWFYANLSAVPALQLTLGGHYEHLTTTAKSIEALSRTEFDPKLGASWNILPNTTVRGAWFATLKRPLIGDLSFQSGQTIEPTQIAGFNQFYDDFTGTKARRWGVGIDQKVPNPFFAGDTLLLGAEWSQRQLTVPVATNVLTPGVPAIVESGAKERYGRAYLSWLLSERLAFNTELDYQALNRTVLNARDDGLIRVQLLQVPIELRYFDPNGLLGLVRTTIVREQGQFLDVTSGDVNPGKGTFATLDMGIGWRYPGRPFIATLEAQNLLDSHLHYQDTDPFNQRIIPRRTFLARVTFRL
jgi:Flp pilus assembly protein TadD